MSELAIGDRLPAFELPDTAGQSHPLPEPGTFTATVVCWTCNHCPYALAWHERLDAAAREYAERGVQFLYINSNDAERYPADSLEAMRERVDGGEFGAPYLQDAGQDVARAYGALKTPDLFVADGDLLLRYRGAPDADHGDPALNAAWLRGALNAVLAGKGPDPAETPPVGCSIKWRE